MFLFSKAVQMMGLGPWNYIIYDILHHTASAVKWMKLCTKLDSLQRTPKHRTTVATSHDAAVRLLPYTSLGPRLKTATLRDSTMDLGADLTACFALEVCERHHSLKGSHPTKFGTKYVSICSSVPLPGWHWWLQLVLARPSTSPKAVALCSYTNHVWAFGVLPEPPPAQVHEVHDGRKSSRFPSGTRKAIEKTSNSCMAHVLCSLAGNVDQSLWQLDLESSPMPRLRTSSSRCLISLDTVIWKLVRRLVGVQSWAFTLVTHTQSLRIFWCIDRFFHQERWLKVTLQVRLCHTQCHCISARAKRYIIWYLEKKKIEVDSKKTNQQPGHRIDLHQGWLWLWLPSKMFSTSEPETNGFLVVHESAMPELLAFDWFVLLFLLGGNACPIE